MYCWYAPNGGGTAQQEFAVTDRYKLYRTGAFYDYSADRDEEKKLEMANLPPEAVAANGA